MKVTYKAIRSALAKLGRSKDQIATSLQKRGIRGDLGCPYDCAVANYLKKVFGVKKGYRFSVDLGAAEYINAITHCKVVGVPISKAIESFIYAFDAKEFPSLIG
jgi:hypothetical protein